MDDNKNLWTDRQYKNRLGKARTDHLWLSLPQASFQILLQFQPVTLGRKQANVHDHTDKRKQVNGYKYKQQENINSHLSTNKNMLN